MTAADVAWSLYREGPAHQDEAAELACGIIADARAGADDVAKAGTLLFAAGRVPEAIRARDAAVARGAAPQLLAYLDTICELARGDGRSARRVLAAHLARAEGRLHPDMPSLAADVGAPLLAWRAGGRAGLAFAPRLSHVVRAGARRAPRRACRVVGCG